MHPKSHQFDKYGDGRDNQVIFRRGNDLDDLELLRRSEQARDSEKMDTDTLNAGLDDPKLEQAASNVMDRQTRSGEEGAWAAVYDGRGDNMSVDEYQKKVNAPVSADHLARVVRTKHIENTDGYH